MKKIKRTYICLFVPFLAALFLVACKDSDDAIQNNSGEGITIEETLTLTFDNIVGDQELLLSDQTYTNQSGEDYEVKELKYIISNIRLTQTDGTVFTYPIDESFFVIDENDPTSLQVNLVAIPSGEYTNLKFGFGIDQSRYPIEQGTLNFVPTAQDKGMLWGWAAGYKFLKMEGDFRANGSDISELFTYHIGSISDTQDNYKEISLSFSKESTDEITTEVTITTDVAQVFDAVNTMSLIEKAEIQVDPENSPKIAENIAKMFSIK